MQASGTVTGSNLSGTNTGDLQTLANGVSDVTATAADLNSLEMTAETVGHVLTIQAGGETADWAAPSGGGDAWSDPVDSEIDMNTHNIRFDDLTGIHDSAGNEVLIFDEVASAANYVQISNNTTGNDPTITTAGDDASIDLLLDAKGTGNIITQARLRVSSTGPLTIGGDDAVIASNSGDTLLNFNSVLSSVNEITIGNNTAGNDPTIAATGDDTNIDVNIIPKGTGQLLVNGSPVGVSEDSVGTTELDDGSSTPATNTVVMVDNADTSQFIYKTVPDCNDETEVLAYDQPTQTWSCNVDAGAGTGISEIVEDTTPQLGGNLDANGFDIQFDDLDGIYDSSGNEMLLFDLNVTPDNYLIISNSNLDPAITTSGADTDVNLYVSTQGAGLLKVQADIELISSSDIRFQPNGGLSDTLDNEFVDFTSVASAVNHIRIHNAITGNDPILEADGTDTNVNLNLKGQGTGVVQANGVDVTLMTESFIIETATTDDDLRVKAPAAIELKSLDCVATGATTPSAQVMTVVECTNAAGSCASSGGTVTLSALTTNYNDSAFTDAVIDDGDWWGLDTTSLTTAADLVHCTVEYTFQ